KILKKQNIKLFLPLFLLLVILLALKRLSLQETIQVADSTPKNGETNVSLSPRITLTFNQKIPSDNWQIISSPEFSFKINIKQNVLEIQPEVSLKPSTQYSLSFKNQKIKTFSFLLSFTTLSVAPSSETGRGDPHFYRQIEKDVNENYPLLKYIPFETKNWWITYRGPLKLQVTFKKDTPALRQEVLDWIRSKGIDPGTHQIEWKVNPNF
ncbi:MAG: Ig-like domain-containing protein, partial [Microgenomates group bacterium]